MQLARLRIPKPYAIVPLDAAREPVNSPFLVSMNDYFGVRMIGAEAMTCIDELTPEPAMIVNLAVVCDPDRSVLVRHRLRGGRAQIDDRQAPMPESDASVRGYPHARPVRPAMNHGVAHARDVLGQHRMPAVELEDSDDAAHRSARGGAIGAAPDLPLDLETDAGRIELLRQWNRPLPAVPQRRSQGLELLELALLRGARGPGPVWSPDNIDGLEVIHSDDTTVHEDFHLLLGMLAAAHRGVEKRRNAAVGISECCDKIVVRSPVAALRLNAESPHFAGLAAGEIVEHVVDVAGLTNITTPALRPVHPVWRRNEPGVHAISHHEGPASGQGHLAGPFHCGRKPSVEARHQHRCRRPTHGEEALDFSELLLLQSKRLLDEDVFTRPKRRQRRAGMLIMASRDDEELHLRVPECLFQRRSRVCRLVLARYRLRVCTRAAHDRAEREFGAQPDKVGQMHSLSKAPGTHERDADP